MKIFSGIRPTGQLHLGNYLGAVKQWLELQNENECVYCIVDWHAITTPYNEKELQKDIKDMAATYLALGLNPQKSIVFVQSHVKEHVELAWIFDTITPVSELTRMTQYKEKSLQHGGTPNMGLLNYPVLMAADILLYKTDTVPVGKDQEQHVELARTIAKKFNQRFGKTFVLPEARMTEGAKIMSFSDPTKKMSKSLGEKSYLGLFDTPEVIEKKVMAAKTDTGKEIKYLPLKKPGISNMLVIFSLLSEKTIKEIEKEFLKKGYGEFKKALSELLIDYLAPFREKREEILSKPNYIEKVLFEGAKKARTIASKTMNEARKKAGLA